MTRLKLPVGVSTVLAGVLCLMTAGVLTAGPAAASGDRASLVDRIVAKADPQLMQIVVTTRDKHGVPRFKTIKVANVAAAKRVVADTLGKPGVAAVEMDRRVKASGYSDPYYPNQWALNGRHFAFPTIRYVTRHDRARPVVAVVDSGVQGSHPDLSGHVVSGYNAITPGASPADDCGHGTHVAGIIGATLNNSRGIVGLAQRAYIRPVKVLGWHSGGLLQQSGCWGSGADVAEGITWAATHARVINLSLESDSPLAAERDAIAYAQQQGVVVVAAAGNSGNNQTVYPAAYPGVIGVAAYGNQSTAPYWTRASFSSYGSWVDVAAPGVGIVSTVPHGLNHDCPTADEWSGGYCSMSGTSMATPYTVAAIVLGMHHCHWGPNTSARWLQRTASHYPRKSAYTGYGVINPLKLLRCGS